MHTCWIPTRGIEFQSCIKTGFWWVIQECLGRFHVGMLAIRSWSRNLQRWPYVLKFHIHLLRKTLVSKFDLKHDPLSMEPQERDTRSTIPMSWIQRNQQFVDWRHGHDSMALVSHLLHAFTNTYRIPIEGIEFQPCIKTRLWWVLEVCLGRFHVGTLATM